MFKFLFAGFCISTACFAAPKLFIAPAPVFDMICQQNTGYVIDPQYFTELDRKKGEFQAAWDDKGDVLVATSEALAGRNYTRLEYSVALVLCKWTPMGHPFIMNARPFLALPNEKALPMSAFVALTHHELLHNLVDNIETEEFVSASEIFKKYPNENYNTLVHLHLMAIQKAAYEQLGESELLSQTDYLYEQYIRGDYKRAWDIVNAEGTEPFLRELKAYNAQKR